MIKNNVHILCRVSGGYRVYEQGPCDYKIKTHRLFCHSVAEVMVTFVQKKQNNNFSHMFINVTSEVQI